MKKEENRFATLGLQVEILFKYTWSSCYGVQTLRLLFMKDQNSQILDVSQVWVIFMWALKHNLDTALHRERK